MNKKIKDAARDAGHHREVLATTNRKLQNAVDRRRFVFFRSRAAEQAEIVNLKQAVKHHERACLAAEAEEQRRIELQTAFAREAADLETSLAQILVHDRQTLESKKRSLNSEMRKLNGQKLEIDLNQRGNLLKKARQAFDLIKDIDLDGPEF